MKTKLNVTILPRLRSVSTKLKKQKSFFLCTLLIFLIGALTSQHSIAQPASATLSFGTHNNNLALCNFMVTLSDTNLVAIELGLGSERNQTDLFLHEFTFDVSTGLPSGLSYSREGLTLTIGIGNQQVLDYYYGQVRVKGDDQQWSEWYQFLQN
jgi:hypothetical protein